MNRAELSTDFASPERSSNNEIFRDINYFKTLEGLSSFLNAIPNAVMVLNSNRQVVYGNRTVLTIADCSKLDEIYGKRPGELLDCLYASENQSGCGTSVFCRNCNAAKSILKSVKGEQNSMECTILRKNNKPAFDLRVCSHPFLANDSKYVVFTSTDISHEKRRRVLERTFFHDIANSLTGVQGYGELMKNSEPENAVKWLRNLMLCTNEAISEIQSHRSLLAAEDGELIFEKNLIRSSELLSLIKEMFVGYSDLRNIKSVVKNDPGFEDVTFESDATLLSRVLINLLKNAFEASNGEQVTVGCNKKDKKVIFKVNNRQHINEEIQNQIFKRSFSTKGTGRGIGTYSVKLLTEKYLGGKVYFNSGEKEGTTFFVELPA